MREKLPFSNVLIVGLARNCAKILEQEIRTLASAFAQSKSVKWLIIESDSEDSTLDALNDLCENYSLRYITLGHLRHKLPKRTERIALCRNRYLEEIKSNPEYEDIDFVVVADLDGVNSELTAQSVSSCWDLTVDWDACFANQSKPYYDIWALRHKAWSPNCWESYRFLLDNGANKFNAIHACVESRMVRINKMRNPIEVESAFGGLGIYKKRVLVQSSYHGLNAKDEEVCEHVSLHEKLREVGFKLYIVPILINCGWNEHNRNLKFRKKIQCRLRHYALVLITLSISKDRLKQVIRKFR
jgi:hypothetical protein